MVKRAKKDGADSESDYESKTRAPMKEKKPLNKWALALKKWNEGKPIYHIPKKGTKEYDEVKALMAKM